MMLVPLSDSREAIILPTLIVYGFVMVAAILALFTGLQLSNAEKQNRRDFEFKRNILHTVEQLGK